MPTRGEMDVDLNEVVTLIGVFAGTALAAYFGYFRQPKPPRQQDSVLTGVGLELGNRQQLDMLIVAVNRVADAIEAKNQASLEDLLQDIKNDMEAMKPPRRR